MTTLQRYHCNTHSPSDHTELLTCTFMLLRHGVSSAQCLGQRVSSRSAPVAPGQYTPYAAAAGHRLNSRAMPRVIPAAGAPSDVFVLDFDGVLVGKPALMVVAVRQ